MERLVNFVDHEVTAAKVAHLSLVELRLAKLYFGLDPQTIDGPACAAIVGEMPPDVRASGSPLFPWPRNSSGARLQKFARLSPVVFMGRFARRNLHQVHGYYSPVDDHAAAETVRAWAAETLGGMDRVPVVVLLGERVAAAFGVGMWQSARETVGKVDLIFAAIPHPSSRARTYRTAEDRNDAARILWAAAGLPID